MGNRGGCLSYACQSLPLSGLAPGQSLSLDSVLLLGAGVNAPNSSCPAMMIRPKTCQVLETWQVCNYSFGKNLPVLCM